MVSHSPLAGLITSPSVVLSAEDFCLTFFLFFARTRFFLGMDEVGDAGVAGSGALSRVVPFKSKLLFLFLLGDDLLASGAIRKERQAGCESR